MKIAGVGPTGGIRDIHSAKPIGGHGARRIQRDITTLKQLTSIDAPASMDITVVDAAVPTGQNFEFAAAITGVWTSATVACDPLGAWGLIPGFDLTPASPTRVIEAGTEGEYGIIMDVFTPAGVFRIEKPSPFITVEPES